ncbi:hypothetical protein K1719_017752 [Acacia pycnantha]|nr:hypothetical protein K1719_017752 [Acacia pycnantha]
MDAKKSRALTASMRENHRRSSQITQLQLSPLFPEISPIVFATITPCFLKFPPYEERREGTHFFSSKIEFRGNLVVSSPEQLHKKIFYLVKEEEGLRLKERRRIIEDQDFKKEKYQEQGHFDFRISGENYTDNFGQLPDFCRASGSTSRTIPGEKGKSAELE